MADELKPKAVVQGKVSKSGKSLWKKLLDTFTAGNIKEAKNYVVTDVIVPGFLDILYDGITRGAGKLIYGDKGAPRERSKHGIRNIDYSSGIKRLSDGEVIRNQVRKRESAITGIYDYNEVELETKADASKLLDSMLDFLDYHDIISVADMYSMAGADSIIEATDNYWGWDTLAGTEITRSGDKWCLTLPRVKNLKDIK